MKLTAQCPGVHWTNVSNDNPAGSSQFQSAVQGGVSAGPEDDQFDDQYRAEGAHWNELGRHYTFERWLPVFPAL